MGSKTDRWFGPIASIIVVAGAACLSLYMGQQVQMGTLPWWPYPAFALLVFGIFTAYSFLTREEN